MGSCCEGSLSRCRLQVLARRDVMTLLGGANTSCVATGVAGVGSNKGAVAIACQVWGTELCFVNAHLAAHQSRSAERNKMFRVRHRADHYTCSCTLPAISSLSFLLPMESRICCHHVSLISPASGACGCPAARSICAI